jgi:hypothetical protein
MSYPSFNEDDNINISNIDKTQKSINEKESNQINSFSKSKANNESSLISSSHHNNEEKEVSVNHNVNEENNNYNSDRISNNPLVKNSFSKYVNDDNDNNNEINDNYNYKSESRNNSHSKLKIEINDNINKFELKKNMQYFPEDSPININEQQINKNESLNENKIPEDTFANLNNMDNKVIFPDNERAKNKVKDNDINDNNNYNHDNKYDLKKQQNEELHNQTIINLKNEEKETKKKFKKKKRKRKIINKCCCCKVDCNSPICSYCCGNRGFIGFYFLLCFCLVIGILIVWAIKH